MLCPAVISQARLMMMVMRISIKHWHATVVYISIFIYFFILLGGCSSSTIIKITCNIQSSVTPHCFCFYSQLTLWYCFNKRVFRIKPAAFLSGAVQRAMTSGDCENNTDKYVVIGMADSTFCTLLRSPAKPKMECQ